MRLRESYSRSESEETQVSKRRFDVKKADSSNRPSLTKHVIPLMNREPKIR